MENSENGGYGMNAKRMAVVLMALLAISVLGGISLGIAQQEPSCTLQVVDFDGDGDDPPSDPNSIPGGDPEHPT